MYEKHTEHIQSGERVILRLNSD